MLDPAAAGQGSLTTSGVVLLFLDGVGLGAVDPALNPLAAANTPVLKELLNSQLDETASETSGSDFVFRRLDATMGHDGLPQSATGQTAILTGANAADVMAGHYGPWPGPTLRRVLEAGTLFDKGAEAGGAALANAYPPGYFAALSGRRYRPSAIIFAATASGLELRAIEDYRSGRAVASDLAGEHFAALGVGAERAGPQAAARAFVDLAADKAFTMLDVWLTDRFGHKQDLAAGRALIERLDVFLGALIEGPNSLPARGQTLIVTSDHGNLEDLTSRSHTRNDVPLLAFGPAAPAFGTASTLLDIAPTAARIMGANPFQGVVAAAPSEAEDDRGGLEPGSDDE